MEARFFPAMPADGKRTLLEQEGDKQKRRVKARVGDAASLDSVVMQIIYDNFRDYTPEQCFTIVCPRGLTLKQRLMEDRLRAWYDH